MAKKTIIHLSDLHVGLRQQETKRTRMVFDRIAKSFPGIPLLITGNLTASVAKKQFKNTKELLDQLDRINPILVVPGNHDYAWKGNNLRSDGKSKGDASSHLTDKM